MLFLQHWIIDFFPCKEKQEENKQKEQSLKLDLKLDPMFDFVVY